MRKKDYILGVLMVLVTFGFCLSGSLVYGLQNSVQDFPHYTGIWGFSIVILKCLFLALVLLGVDIIRNNFHSAFLGNWSALLFCVAPIAVIELLIYSGVFDGGMPDFVADLVFGIAQWGEYVALLMVITFAWNIYRIIASGAKKNEEN